MQAPVASSEVDNVGGLTVEYRAIAELRPYGRNARTHSDAQVSQIVASIREFGWTNPILVDEGGTVIGGHGRLVAATRLAMSEVPTIRLAGLTAAQRRALVLADNKLALNAGWDDVLLGEELTALSASDFDIGLLGFSDAELTRFLPRAGSDTDPDEVPEPPAVPVSRVGDVWTLGAHRLICGDATDPSVIADLMQGDAASLCFTSPPYGNQRDYTSGGTIDWDGLMRGVFQNVPMAEDGQLLVNLGLIHRENEVVPYWDAWLTWMRSQGWRRFGWYVWDQGPGLPGDWTGRLAPSFEFVFHFNRVSRKPNKIVPCKHAGGESHIRADGSSTAMRAKNGKVGSWVHAGRPTQDTRIPDSVVRIMVTRRTAKAPSIPLSFRLSYRSSWLRLTQPMAISSSSHSAVAAQQWWQPSALGDCAAWWNWRLNTWTSQFCASNSATQT